ARLLSDDLGKRLGQTIVVENKAGASTAVGASSVARAPNDGYTLLMAAATTFSTNPHLYKDLNYKLQDFDPVGMVVRVPFAFVVKKDLPVNNIAEFIEHAKKQPTGLNQATNGNGSLVHLAGYLVGKELGVPLTFVHYRGAAPAMTDMMGGVVDSNVEALTNAVPNVMDNRYKALAVLSEERAPGLPDVPTFKELGYPELVAESYFAIFAPAGTPKPALDKLSRALAETVGSETFKAAMSKVHNMAVPSTAEELGAYAVKESERWGKIIQEGGIKLD
nr:tripartite tricarboxylate transporter substrate binding protein [Pseudomonas sp.]